MHRLILLSFLILVPLGCDDGSDGSGGNTDQTGQINTVADIENKLQAEQKTVEIRDCVILVIKDSNGNVINTGEISDITSSISTANTFGVISDSEAAAAEDFIGSVLEKAGCSDQ